MPRPSAWLVLLGILAGCEVYTDGRGSGVEGPVPGEDAGTLVIVDAGTASERDGSTPPPPPPPGEDAGARAETRHARVIDTAMTGLNVRTGPGTENEVIAVVPEACLVEVMSAPDGSWYDVGWRDARGWVHGAYLELVPEGTPDPCDGYDVMLPWTAGDAYEVVRGHDTESHTDGASRAWDFALPPGTEVRASTSGVVRQARVGDASACDERYGERRSYVVVDRGDGIETLYLHLSSVGVAEGERVSRGQIIGRSGAPAPGCMPYLHFQVQLSSAYTESPAWFQPSVRASFYDEGVPVDPGEGDVPVSHNEPVL